MTKKLGCIVILVSLILAGVCFIAGFLIKYTIDYNTISPVQIHIFLDEKLGEDRISQLKEDILNIEGIKESKYISTTDAYKEYLQYSKINNPGLYNVLLSKEDKRLPASIEISFTQPRTIEIYKAVRNLTKDMNEYVDIRLEIKENLNN